MDPKTSPPITILRLQSVAARVGMGRSWIYREVAAGRFPQQIKIGSSTGWASTEIDEWLSNLVAARTAGQTH